MNRVLFFAAILISVLHGVLGACKKISACSCELDNGDKIDLSPLASDDQKPKFEDVPDSQQLDEFSYNPCTAFSEGGCSNVAVCQIQKVPVDNFFSLGTQDSASFSDSDGKISIQYSDEDGGVVRTTYVALKCDKNVEGTLSVGGERATSAVYDLELTTKYVCYSAGGLSPGSILLIIFFACCGLYFLVGVPVQIFIRKESGARVIPFSDFWRSFPGLVKAGTFFVISRGKRGQYQEK